MNCKNRADKRSAPKSFRCHQEKNLVKVTVTRKVFRDKPRATDKVPFRDAKFRPENCFPAFAQARRRVAPSPSLWESRHSQRMPQPEYAERLAYRRQATPSPI